MGTFFIVNIMYILSPAYIDVIVPCNVPDVWNSAFGPVFVSEAPMSPTLCVSLLARLQPL